MTIYYVVLTWQDTSQQFAIKYLFSWKRIFQTWHQIVKSKHWITCNHTHTAMNVAITWHLCRNKLVVILNKRVSSLSSSINTAKEAQPIRIALWSDVRRECALDLTLNYDYSVIECLCALGAGWMDWQWQFRSPLPTNTLMPFIRQVDR